MDGNKERHDGRGEHEDRTDGSGDGRTKKGRMDVGTTGNKEDGRMDGRRTI
jgi:hypothetical protein